jgi:superfamily II DNA or RNA helicase
MELNSLKFKGQFRDYQKKILDNSKKYLDDGKINIAAAPGSGKTTLGLELICRLGKPALILAPSITIRQQWGERFSDAFLPEGENSENYISYNISGPGKLTCITYQALYSAMSGKEAEVTDDEEESNGDSLKKAPLRKLDVSSIMKRNNITTICLDEAHHLRTEWHRALTKLINDMEGQITIIALTATPPYDSTPTEWKKYTDLCGEIDAEISIPELVRQKTLCPHQDLVLFSYPTEAERKEINSIQKRSAKAAKDVLKSGLFEDAYTFLDQNINPDREDYLYQHIEDFRSFLYCVKYSGVKLPSRYNKLIYEKIKTVIFFKNNLQTGCQFVIDNPDLFGENISEMMLSFFRERHVTDRKRIDLFSSKETSALLASSMGKIGGIKTIVKAETDSLGSSLRMVILTDYIKKNLINIIGTDEPLTEMGTVPIFESIRREKISGIRPAVISGTLTIIPDTALPALKKLSEEEESSVTIKPIKETGFSKVDFAGGNKKKVSVVTDLFQKGEINILIGTKSLLGEGWDCPSINSLILASFVGSFMLSNQMRGRAIRIDKEHPDKVANIWHLITAYIDECLSKNIESIAEGKDIYENSMTLGEDYESVARRFECFMGPSIKEDVIQSGIERLGIDRFIDRSGVERSNAEMLSLASDREEAKNRWIRSLSRCQYSEIEICQKNEFKKETLPTAFGFINLALELIYAVAGTIFSIILLKIGFNLMAVLISIAIYLSFIYGIHIAIRLISPSAVVRGFAQALLKTFRKSGAIQSENVIVNVSGSSDGLYTYSTLRGGTLREKQIFADAMRELLSPMDNPRYIIIKSVFHVPLYFFSLSCPTLIGNKRETADVFRMEFKKQFGNMILIYTRNEEGHTIYKKCVKQSFVNLEVNQNGNIVRKEVY